MKTIEAEILYKTNTGFYYRDKMLRSKKIIGTEKEVYNEIKRQEARKGIKIEEVITKDLFEQKTLW